MKVGFVARLAHIPALIYRCYDSTDVLLYVGSTHELQFAQRQAHHREKARWWCHVARVESEVVESGRPQASNRLAAYNAEWHAIKTELPIFNQHGAAPGQADREAAYLARQLTLRAKGVTFAEMGRRWGVHEVTVWRWAHPKEKNAR